MFDTVLLFFISTITVIHSTRWDYHRFGPDTWSDYYPICAGRFQSPINILTPCTQYKSFEPFRFSSAYQQPRTFLIQNTGQTIIANAKDHVESLSKLQISGGGLNGTFEFVNLHLHWGENYKSGSEHRINGRKYAGEIHFVHQNPETGQLAVLGIFMESYLKEHGIPHPQHLTHQSWKKYLTIAKKLKHQNHSTMFDLSISSLLGDRLNEFWRYEGSLTTPPCTEGIIWTVFRHPIVFSEEQLQKLREAILFEVYRDPQQMYNRIVYRNFHPDAETSIPDFNLCVNETGRIVVSSSDFFQNVTQSPIFYPFLFFFLILILGLLLVKLDFHLRKTKGE